MVNSGHVQKALCDDIFRQYQKFTMEAGTADSLLHFLEQEGWAHFSFSSLVKKEEYHHLWGVVDVVLLLNHDQVTVERDPQETRRPWQTTWQSAPLLESVL